VHESLPLKGKQYNDPPAAVLRQASVVFHLTPAFCCSAAATADSFYLRFASNHSWRLVHESLPLKGKQYNNAPAAVLEVSAVLRLFSPELCFLLLLLLLLPLTLFTTAGAWCTSRCP
jgi:hypothetical protein